VGERAWGKPVGRRGPCGRMPREPAPGEAAVLGRGAPAIRVSGGPRIPGFVVTVLTHRHASARWPAGQGAVRGCAGLCGAVRAWPPGRTPRGPCSSASPPPRPRAVLAFSPSSGQRQALLQRPRAGGGGGGAPGGRPRPPQPRLTLEVELDDPGPRQATASSGLRSNFQQFKVVPNRIKIGAIYR